MPVGYWIKAAWIDCESHRAEGFWVLRFAFWVLRLCCPARCLAEDHSKLKTQNPKRKTVHRLLPFNGAWWLSRNIVADSVDAFDLVDDSSGDSGEDFVGDPDPIGRHSVLAFDDP
jgi:hypothetical protein